MTDPAGGPTSRRRRTGLVLASAVLVLVTGVAALLLAARGDDGSPAAGDFIAIARAPRQPPAPGAGPDASTGSFESWCGRNENAHLNADNLIRSPGQPYAAQHGHEYVGNLATNAFSTDTVLATAGTTCANGDLSTYSWPVLRVLNGRADNAGTDDATGGPGNTGVRVPAASVLVQFRGNPVSKVVAMPRFLRVVTGDARARTAVTGPGGAQWTCSGFVDRRTPLYPVCPNGRRVLRIYDFPSCWDGRRTDSPSHREHVVFPAANGVCPRDTFAIPQLHLETAYLVPAGRSFAIDTFPERRRSPTTDHADFINVMPETLMAGAVACVNGGRHC